MSIRATCSNCSKDFYFQQVYNAPPEDADRCPNCSAHLGVVNLRNSTAAADAALASLASALHTIMQREPAFSIVGPSVLAPIERAVQNDLSIPADPKRRRHRRKLATRRVVS